MASLASAVDAQNSWEFIRNGVDMVMKGNQQQLDPDLYLSMYTAVHNYCVTPYIQPSSVVGPNTNVQRLRKSLPGGELYARLQDYLAQHVAQLCEQLPSDSSKGLISYYNACWKQYIKGSTRLNHIFSYLNRHWVKQERDEGSQRKMVCEVYTLCLYYWQTMMFQSKGQLIISSLLSEINTDRDGGVVDKEGLKLCISSIVQIGLDVLLAKRPSLIFYTENFEEPFLQATTEYYNAEANRILQSQDVVSYMRQVDLRLKQEKQRVSDYLNSTSEEALMKECERVLIQRHIAPLQQEFIVLLRNENHEDLYILYKLLGKVDNGLDPVRANLEQFVQEQGMLAVQTLVDAHPGENIDPKVYVETLLQVCDHYENLVATTMDKSPVLAAAVQEGSMKFINNNVVAKPNPGLDSRTPELLARFSDTLLKKSSKPLDALSIEQGLRNILKVLSLTEEKDVFEKHYTRMLSRRLVQETSSNPDLETQMITLLGEVCGFEYTNKLQRMFQDKHTSFKLQKMFHEIRPEDQFSQTFNPLVLAEGFWPLPYRNIKNFKLPEPLKETFDQFNNFYDKMHNGRRLKWLWNFGKGDMNLNMPNGKSVTLSVNVYQMAILLAFNDADSISKQELYDLIPISHELLDSSLGYILKAGVLVESQQDTFTFNESFESKKARINLNLPLKGEPKPENTETEKQMEEKRQSFLQSVIVRIMKINRAYPHDKLTEETMRIALTKFRPSPADVTRAIEALLERQYIRKSEQVMDVYEYVS